MTVNVAVPQTGDFDPELIRQLRPTARALFNMLLNRVKISNFDPESVVTVSVINKVTGNTITFRLWDVEGAGNLFVTNKYGNAIGFVDGKLMEHDDDGEPVYRKASGKLLHCAPGTKAKYPLFAEAPE